MSLKAKKGITLVALVITVILMLILAGVGLHFGTEALEKSELEDIKTDMISIKAKAKIIVEQYNFKDIENLVGEKITEQSEANEIGIETEEDINNLNLYKWSSSDLEGQNLSKIDGNKYIVEYNLEEPNDSEVYYIDGFKGKHSLSDLQQIED